MAHITFFSMPSMAHIDPTLGVVRELLRRGHTVRYFAHSPFQKVVEETGAKFISYPDENAIREEDVDSLGRDLVTGVRLLVKQCQAAEKLIMQEMTEHRPDCIVTDTMAVWGRAAAQRFQIPLVISSSGFAFNQHCAKEVKQSNAAAVLLMFSMGKLNRAIKKLHDQQGFPASSVVEFLDNGNYPTIVYTASEFQPHSETFSDEYAFVGPVLKQRDKQQNKKKRKLIYIAPGRGTNHIEEFCRCCFEAVKQLDADAVIVLGNQVNQEKIGILPDNVVLISDSDQSVAFQQADVFLTHCDLGSVSEALWNGIPMVLWPQTPEEEAVADRAVEVGVGKRLLRADSFYIHLTLEQVMNSPEFTEKASEMKEKFHVCRGAVAAADHIEASLEQE